MRRHIIKLLVLVTFIVNFGLVWASNAGESIAVIVNVGNPVASLSETDIKKIYDNNVLRWPDGVPITIYELAIQDPIRYTFSERIFGRTPDMIAEEWAHLKITNQAKNPPQTIKSEALIIRKVSNEKGSIGYVSLDSVKNLPGVKVVNTIQ